MSCDKFDWYKSKSTAALSNTRKSAQSKVSTFEETNKYVASSQEYRTWITSLRSGQTSNKKKNYFNQKKGSEGNAINFELNKVN
jgi:hypothetical protein